MDLVQTVNMQQVMEELTNTFDFPAETLFVVFDQTSDETIKETFSKIERINIAESIQSPLETTLSIKIMSPMLCFILIVILHMNEVR